MKNQSNDVKSLGEALPEEIARVTEMAALYDTIPEGRFTARLMRMECDQAVRAIAEGDMIKMLAAYQSLKEYTSV